MDVVHDIKTGLGRPMSYDRYLQINSSKMINIFQITLPVSIKLSLLVNTYTDSFDAGL